MTTATEPQFLTADGSIFDPVAEYYFWKADDFSIRKTDGLRRVRGWMLDELDREVVAVGQLHRSRDSAIESGQKAILRQIDQLKNLVDHLENEKTPKARTLKYRLQARQL